MGGSLLLGWLLHPWPDTPDGLFHLHRIRALSDALRWWVLYPRWFPDFAFGYGYPVLNFYAPASYYPPALLHLLGVPLIPAARVSLALMYGLSLGLVYSLLRRTVHQEAALLGTALFAFWPYRFYDLFVRGALPEFWAFLWLPLLLYLTHPKGAHGGKRASLLTALAWSALILTHNLTAFMMGLVTWLFVLDRVHRWKDVGVPLLLAGGLSAFYILPVWGELKFVGLGTSSPAGYSRHLIPWTHVFTWTVPFSYPQAASPTIPLPGYVSLLFLGTFLLFLRRRPVRHLLPFAGVTLLLLWLQTDLSAPVWEVGAPLLGLLQFPWRWQAPLGILVAWWGSELWEAWGKWPSSSRGGVLLLLVILGYFAVGRLHPPAAEYTSQDLTPEQMWAFDAQHGQVGASWTGEFLPRWVKEQRWAIGREPAEPNPIPPDPAPEVRPLRVGYTRLLLHTQGETRTRLTFHRFYYPAWDVQVDGRAMPTEPVTNLGLLSVSLPPGEHTLLLQWRGTRFQQVGGFLSAVSWLLLLGLLMRSTPSPRERRGLWGLTFLVLGILAWRLFLPHGRWIPVHPVEGRAPGVRLVGWARPPSAARVHVRLFWLGEQAPIPRLSAFLHLEDREGRLMAQKDGPVGTPYTPPARWFAGFWVPEDRTLPLPEGGRGPYRLWAGVYSPDDPAHPFFRVEVGRSDDE
ncbi:MAG: hypothetical protein GXO55_02075 [Chloroflexi bacterium]|nr:hypothetical protein [Chloroflexota bacterium]